MNTPRIGHEFKTTVSDELAQRKIIMATPAGRDFIFAKCAELRQIHPTAIEDYIIADGLETLGPNEHDKAMLKAPSADSPADIWERAEKIGLFQDNNGVITYINEKGQICIARSTKKNHDALTQAGYISETTRDVVSNGQKFKDPGIQEKWTLFGQRAEKQRQAEAQEAQTLKGAREQTGSSATSVIDYEI
ncbi:TPA: hypothetical protein DCZ16_00530 [Candidatus Peregrinibacteria bacterium]|nr:hypothetical protein [Candidatus Peregrinibacteria bacterium]